MTYPIVRLDNMSGTTDPAQLRSVEFCTYDSEAGTYAPAEVNNGAVVKLVKLDVNNREVWIATAPAKGDALRNLALVATPELMYDERKHNLDEFTNEAGTIARGYRFVEGNIFSETADGFTIASGYTPAVGAVVELTDGTSKMAIVASGTASTTQVGTVVAIETVMGKTYYRVEVI